MRDNGAVKHVRLLTPLLLIASGCGFLTTSVGLSDTPEPSATFVRNEACDLPPMIVERIRRGSRVDVSEDIVVVPRGFNHLGSFEIVSHSGPRNYLQQIPLIFYGPGYVPSAGGVDRPVTLASVYPTMGKLLGVPLDTRAEDPLDEALVKSDGTAPRLVVFVVWDGAGTNVLERWPDAWPRLRELALKGTYYPNATVGSSPSITPATHSTLGTGAFPDEHGVTGIQRRTSAAKVGVTFQQRNPASIEMSTFADDIDLALDNEPVVGLLGWRSWHMGMLGHGSAIEGADRDELGIIGFEQRISGRRPEFVMPDYLREWPGLDRSLAEADASDGERDGRWRNHPLADDHDNPGWIRYQSNALLGMLEKGGYGSDDVPDLMFTNFKTTDRVGHLYNMDSREMEAVLRAQDIALGRMVDRLDQTVRDYVVVVTADHGHTPSPARTGAWAIHQRELEDDLDRRFDVSGPASLTQATTASGLFINRPLMEELDVEEGQVVDFLRNYTIEDNWSGENLPPGYEDRGDETVFSAAFSASHLDEVAACAGSVNEERD